MNSDIDPSPMVPLDSEAIHPRVSDSIFDTYEPQMLSLAISPVDGMPDVVTQHYTEEDVLPPSLSEETLVCLAQPERHVPVPDQPGQVRVYPAVPKCQYYKRVKARDTEIGRFIIQRYCTCPDLKGLSGAALDLRDTVVPCCEMRDPPDGRSEEELDKVDAEKIALGKNREFFPLYMTPEEARAKRLGLKSEISASPAVPTGVNITFTERPTIPLTQHMEEVTKKDACDE